MNRPPRDPAGNVLTLALICPVAGVHSSFYLNAVVYKEEHLSIVFGIDVYESTSTQVSASTNYHLGEWIHIAVVFDNDTLKLYLNGTVEAVESDVAVSFARANTEELLIGIQRNPEACSGSPEFWYPLNGAIDDVRLYTRALASKEIRALSTP